MIALVLAGMLLALAAPDSPAPPPAAEAYVPADTALKVPGAWLRFGHSPEAIQARGSFAAAHVAGAAGYTARRGTVRWFGIESEATLLFRDERLAWVRFSVSKPARHWIDYASDELRRRGYHPRCETNEPGSRRCDWDGATHVRLEADDQLLQAEVTALPPRRPPAPLARRDTVPVLPEVLSLGGGARDSTCAVPEVTSELSAPEYPRAARDAGVQGRVWVRALVDTDGVVIETRVVRSIPELDSVAVATVAHYLFVPYVHEGRRVRFRVDVPVIFTLH